MGLYTSSELAPTTHLGEVAPGTVGTHPAPRDAPRPGHGNQQRGVRYGGASRRLRSREVSPHAPHQDEEGNARIFLFPNGPHRGACSMTSQATSGPTAAAPGFAPPVARQLSADGVLELGPFAVCVVTELVF